MILTLYSLQIEPLSLFMNSFLFTSKNSIDTHFSPASNPPPNRFFNPFTGCCSNDQETQHNYPKLPFNATLFCSQVSCNLIINHSTGSFFLFPFFVPSIQSNAPDHQYRIGWHLLSPFVDLFDALPSFRLRIQSIFFSAVRVARKGWHNGP